MHLRPLRGDPVNPVRRFRSWEIEGVVVTMPPETPYGTPVPKTLADVPENWTRRPITPPNPGRPGGR